MGFKGGTDEVERSVPVYTVFDPVGLDVERWEKEAACYENAARYDDDE